MFFCKIFGGFNGKQYLCNIIVDHKQGDYMHQPKFSFVLSAYKAIFLKDAIQSIVSQSYRDFELIIVNDASPDDLASVVHSFSDPRISYHENKTNIGRGSLVKQWTKCLDLAKGEYTIMASDDDVYDNDFLMRITEMTMKYPQVNVLRGRVIRIDKNGNERDWEFPLDEFLSQDKFCLYWSKGLIDCMANYIYKTSVLKEKGFVSFPCAHYSDVATSLAMSDHGIACCNQAIFRFRSSTVNLSNSSNCLVTVSQIHATQLFFDWLTDFTKECGYNATMQACIIYFYKNQYLRMLSLLYRKLGCSLFLRQISNIVRDKHLFKKERVRLLLSRML